MSHWARFWVLFCIALHNMARHASYSCTICHVDEICDGFGFGCIALHVLYIFEILLHKLMLESDTLWVISMS